MNALEMLHNEAYEADIDVRYAYLGDNIKAVCMSVRGVKGIGLNRGMIETSEEERMTLIHELVHFELDLLYKLPEGDDSPEQKADRRHAEAKVRRRAIIKAMPICDIQRCVSKGMTELWEFADELGFMESDVAHAIQYYRTTGELLQPNYLEVSDEG